jgi:hypothetical protein
MRLLLYKCSMWVLTACMVQGSASKWHKMLASLPRATQSPVLWAGEERARLLRGSPTLAEAEAREAALRAEWQLLADAVAQDATRFPPGSSPAFLCLHPLPPVRSWALERGGADVVTDIVLLLIQLTACVYYRPV